MGRLRSLARAREALAASQWRGHGVGHRGAMRQPLAEKNVRIEVRAGDQELPPRTATPLALALHELTTNAVKHGALSKPEGRVSLTVELSAPALLLLRWEETGAGVPRAAPAGTGLQIVRGLVEPEIGGRLHTTLGPAGRAHRLTIPFEPIESPP